MKYVTITNHNQPSIPPLVARYCQSFLCQLRGLMFRRSLSSDQGLLLVQGSDTRLESSIHMMFMWIDLSVVWINSDHEVVDVRLARRWAPMYIPRRPARYVLEISASRLNDFHVGDKVSFHEAFLD